MKILILYSEIASYTITCLKSLLEKNVDIEVHLFRWPVNKEAPFQFSFPDKVKVYERSEYTDLKLVNKVVEISPSLIVCSGWMDKGYLKVAKKYFGKIPTVLTLDNHWRGDVKQRLAALISPFYLKNRFSHVWVPGESQFQFARKLGYPSTKIKKGFYSADVDLFNKYYKNSKSIKEEQFPKVILYVGRYVRHKGIFDLWNAFIELQKEFPNEWELWCVGTGEEYDNRVVHEQIKHFGFIQPENFEEIIQKSGVYILPSHFEPWGVSLHEFVAAGFPVLCSEKVGASEKFLKNGQNGFQFEAGNIVSIKNSLMKIINSSENELIDMQKKSIELSSQITPKKWAETLISFLND